jgi:ubiquinone/menaquinone biosynthesis C-methylase UbiE/DNA-binding transcriptional ArsR family regulator
MARGMEDLLAALRAAAEPTRLRLLALAAQGAFTVTEFTEILGQSQPRLSRHLRLLCEAGLLERLREGANAWFGLPADGSKGAALARALLAHLPQDDPVLAADRRQAARVLAERARVATESFRRAGAEWDEMRALGLPAEAVEQALLALLPAAGLGRVLDIGTGTGRLLELLGPRASSALGVDASRQMLALARARLARAGLSQCVVRLADMYRLPLPDASFDLVLMQMVLHHADDPAAALAEAARVLRAGGRLVVIDLAPHDNPDCLQRLAHRWPGFGDAEMRRLLDAAGVTPAESRTVVGPLEVRLWPAERAVAPAPGRAELASAG